MMGPGFAAACVGRLLGYLALGLLVLLLVSCGLGYYLGRAT